MTTHSASEDASSSATSASQSSDASDAESETSEGDDDAAVVQAADGGKTNGATDTNGDETVPHIELDLYQLSVRVSGQSNDSLDDVETSAKGLMEFLIQQARQLEDEPDTRGLS